ncbi:MAG: hypothetical protein LBP76_05695, partial [Treponema sp.]|nr:hypothetical protein [Treponema sp.]
MDTRQTIPEWKAAADELWAVLKETDRIVKESAQKQAVEAAEAALRLAEIDRIMKENAKGFIELRESQKETERSLKETDRIMKENALRQAERSA